MTSIDPFTVFNRFEIQSKRTFSEWKLRTLRILVVGLVRLGVTANVVSFASFAAAFSFFCVCAVGGRDWLAVAFLLVSIFLDNLDGTVADYVGHREAGPVVDVFYDLAALACVLNGLVWRQEITYGLGLLFWGLYVLIMLGAFWIGPSGAKAFVARMRIVIYAGLLVNLLAPRERLGLDPWLIACIAFQVVSLLSILVVGLRHRAACRLPRAHRLLGATDWALALVTAVLVGVAWGAGVLGARG